VVSSVSRVTCRYKAVHAGAVDSSCSVNTKQDGVEIQAAGGQVATAGGRSLQWPCHPRRKPTQRGAKVQVFCSHTRGRSVTQMHPEPLLPAKN
jgi:hypothetical protein